MQGGSEGRDETMEGESDGDEAAAVEFGGGGSGEGETSMGSAASAALVASMEVFELFECSEWWVQARCWSREAAC